MLFRLVIYSLLLVVLYLLIKRGLGLLLTRLARSKALQIEVKGVGLGLVQGIHIHLPKGPVADLWVEEVSLGRTRGAKKLYDGIARAAANAEWRLPFTVRGLRIELRATGSQPRDPTDGQPRRHRRNMEFGRMLQSLAARGLLGVLPFVPMRLKDVVIVHQDTGIVLEVNRVQLLIKSPQLFTKLEACLWLSPLSLCLETRPEKETASASESSKPVERVPILDIKETQLGVDLLWAREGICLRCQTVACDIGEVTASISLALLLALASLPTMPRKPKASNSSRQKGSNIAAGNLPDKITGRLPLLRLQAFGLGPSQLKLGACLEVHEAVLACSRPSVTESEAITLELYRATVTTGSMQLECGIVSKPSAASLSCPGFGLEVVLIQEPGPAPPLESQQSSGHLLRAMGSLQALKTKCCPEAVWASSAVVQDIQALLDERRRAFRASNVRCIENGAGVDVALGATAAAATEASVVTPGIVTVKAGIREKKGQAAEGSSEEARHADSPDRSRTSDDHQSLLDAAHANRPAGTAVREEISTTDSSAAHESQMPSLAWELLTHLAEDSTLVVQDLTDTVLICCGFQEARIAAGSSGRRKGADNTSSLQSNAIFEVKGGQIRVCESGPDALLQVCYIGEISLGARSATDGENSGDGLQLKGLLSVKRLGITVSEHQLGSLAKIAQSFQPPPGLFKPRGTKSSKPRGQHPEGGPIASGLRFIGASAQLSQFSLEYSTDVQIRGEHQLDSTPSLPQDCIQRLTMGEGSLDLSTQTCSLAAGVSDAEFSLRESMDSVASSDPLSVLQLHSLKVTARQAQSISGDAAQQDIQIEKASASVELLGLTGQFEAEPVFAACKLAADLKRFRALLMAKSTSYVVSAGNVAPLTEGNVTKAMASKKAAKTSILKELDLEVSLRAVTLVAKLSEAVVWGITVGQAQAALLPQNACVTDLVVLLNEAELARISGAVFSLHTKARQGLWPTAGVPLSRQATGQGTSLGSSDDPIFQGEFEAVATTSPTSRPPSGSRRSAALSQESLPSVTEESEMDLGSPSITGKAPVQPLSGNTPSLNAAYTRAGLQHWVDPPSSNQQQSAEAGLPPLRAWQPPKPVATLECCFCDVLVTLPYDQDPGTAQRFTELWAKAFQEALKERLEPLKKQQALSKTKGSDQAASEEPFELRLALRGLLFKMDHHPMEAWLAVKGPLLKSAATQDSLWSRAMAAVGSKSATPARDVSSPVTSPKENRKLEHERRQAVAAEVSRSYWSKSEAAKTDQSLGTREGALMHVRAESVDAVVVICASGPKSTTQALQSIASVDAASEGVAMRQVRKLYLDVDVRNAAAYFSGGSMPLAALSGLTVSGALMLGRQITSPPQQYMRPIAVSQKRSVTIPVTVKGSRALIKVYSDLKAVAEDPRVAYSIGLEPTIALVGQAGKRLSPSDPDKSRPKPPTLPWFDMLRFVWRGNLDIVARNFEFALGASSDPNLHSSSERLQANADALSLRWRPGRIDISFQALSACGYLAADLDEPAGMLHMLPLIDFPACELGLNCKWILPAGRRATEHHLFPVPVPEGQQGPVDVVGIYKSSGVKLGLGLSCAKRASEGLEPEGSPSSSGLGFLQAAPTQDAIPPAILYAGGHQVAFMKLLIERLQCPPLWNKMVNRRGTYFQRADPKRPPNLGIPKLIKQLDIHFAAPLLDVVNYTIDLDEASCGITVSCGDMAFSSSLLMNMPAPRPILPGYTAYSQKREAMRVASALLRMDVQASAARLHWKDATEWDKQRYRQCQEHLMKAQDRGAANSSRVSTASTETLRTLMRNASSSEVFIAAISHLHVHETRPHPKERFTAHSSTPDRRPLKVAIRDCRFYIDVEGRNAVWGAVAHLVGAIRLPRKHMPFTPNILVGSDDAAIPSTPGPGRRHSSRELIVQKPDAESAVPELLSLLLQQRDDQAQSDVEEEPLAETAAQVASDNEGSEDGEAVPDEGTNQEAEDAVVRAQLRDANEEAKQQAWQEEEQEWSQGERNWEVELEGLQICLQASEQAGGRFMLAAQRAALSGRYLKAAQLNAIHLDIDKVQALIAQTSVDPGASASWLAYQDGELQGEASTGPGSLREVFTPFSLKLRNTKAAAQPGINGSQSPTHASRGGTGEETRLLVPFINISMDSKEFHILVDVINNVGLAEPPEVSTVNNDLQLLEEGESQEVNNMQDTYASLRSYLYTLMAETFAVRSALGMRLQRPPSMGKNHYQPLSQSSYSMSRLSRTEMTQAVNLATALEDVSNISNALSDYLSRLFKPDSPQEGLALGPAVGQQLVLRWGQDQVDGARQALHSTAKLLRDLRKIAQRHRQARHATRLLLEVDGVTWSLCHERKQFLEIALATILLDNIRHRDRSGSSKLVIQRMEVMDATASLSATPGTPKGAVLIPWNPDESWKRDALLRVNAVLGPPTRSHTVYEHVDVMVHPLGVHLVEAVAARFWEYFFPKEDAAVSERQKRWVKSVEPRARHSRKGSAASNAGGSSDGETGPAPPASVFAAAPGPMETSLPPGSLSSHTSPGAATSAPAVSDQGHRRGQSWESDRLSEDMPRAVHSATVEPQNLDPAVLQSAWLDNLLRQQSGALSSTAGSGAEHAKGSGHRRSASLDDSAAVAASAAGVPLQPETQEKPEKRGKRKRKAQQVQPLVRKVLFVHVRINRLHCRVTYQGYPISFSDFKMVLDNRVYRSLDGRWRDLFNRIKWDTIKSVLKSVAGLQGRKFKELLPSWERDERPETEKKAAAVAVRSWITNLGKKKKGLDSEEGGSPLDADALRDKAKSRLLLGSQHLSRSGHSTGGQSSTLPTVYSGSQAYTDDPAQDGSDTRTSFETLSETQRTTSGPIASPSKPPSGSRMARPASGLSLEDLAAKASSPQDRQHRTPSPRSFEWGRDVSADPLGSSSHSRGTSPQASAEVAADPAGVGLNLAELLRGRSRQEAGDQAAAEEAFTWGRDISEGRTQPTAKAKAAKLFGKAGSMLKDAGSSMSSATVSVAHQAQVAAAKARAAQAERRANAGTGEPAARSRVGAFLSRPHRPGSLEASVTGRLSREAMPARATASRSAEMMSGATAERRSPPLPAHAHPLPNKSGSQDTSGWQRQTPGGSATSLLQENAFMDTLKQPGVPSNAGSSLSLLQSERPAAGPPASQQQEALLIDLDSDPEEDLARTQLRQPIFDTGQPPEQPLTSVRQAQQRSGSDQGSFGMPELSTRTFGNPFALAGGIPLAAETLPETVLGNSRTGSDDDFMDRVLR